MYLWKLNTWHLNAFAEAITATHFAANKWLLERKTLYRDRCQVQLSNNDIVTDIIRLHNTHQLRLKKGKSVVVCLCRVGGWCSICSKQNLFKPVFFFFNSVSCLQRLRAWRITPQFYKALWLMRLQDYHRHLNCKAAFFFFMPSISSPYGRLSPKGEITARVSCSDPDRADCVPRASAWDVGKRGGEIAKKKEKEKGSMQQCSLWDSMLQETHASRERRNRSIIKWRCCTET